MTSPTGLMPLDRSKTSRAYRTALVAVETPPRSAEQRVLEEVESFVRSLLFPQPISDARGVSPPQELQGHSLVAQFPTGNSEEGEAAARPKMNGDDAERRRRIQHEGFRPGTGDTASCSPVGINRKDELARTGRQQALTAMRWSVALVDPEEIDELRQRSTWLVEVKWPSA